MPKYCYKIFNFIFLLDLFGIFKNTPLYLIDKFLDIFCAFFCLFYLTYSFFSKPNEFYSLGRKVIICFLIIFGISVIASYLQYKQKITEGMAAQIDCLQVFILAFYAYAFNARKLKIESFERYIKYFIILNIIILVLFKDYVNKETSLTGSHALTFKSNYLPMQFIRFGVIYFFVMFLKRGKYIYGIISVGLLFFPNILVHFERGYFAYNVMVMILTIMMIRKSQKFFSKFIIAILVLPIVLIIAISFSGSFGANIIAKYGDIISGVTQGTSGDRSVNYRLQEVPAALKLLKKDPLFGSGKLNSANSILVTGIDLYPSDIGVIGILGAYGFVGLIVFIVIFYYAIKTFRRTIRNNRRYSVMTMALGIYFMGICVNAIQTAEVMLTPAFWSFIYMLYLYSKKLDDEYYQQKLAEWNLLNVEEAADTSQVLLA
jgi:O-antigen ligase